MDLRVEDICLPVLCRVQVLLTSCFVIGSYYVALAGTLSTFITAGVTYPCSPGGGTVCQFVFYKDDFLLFCTTLCRNKYLL